MPLIEDHHADTRGWIIFPILSADCFDAIATFYRVTGALPMAIEERPDADCVVHLVQLRHLPSLLPMGIASAPTYTVEYQTDSFEHGVTRLIIRNSGMRCVVRFEHELSGWKTFDFETARLRYFTD